MSTKALLELYLVHRADFTHVSACAASAESCISAPAKTRAFLDGKARKPASMPHQTAIAASRFQCHDHSGERRHSIVNAPAGVDTSSGGLPGGTQSAPDLAFELRRHYRSPAQD